ncbi:hypothetical protein M0802_011134 [Mischocyttarus mexicanus]|nr:hypothetical protein M0802_011134 [Mischocyttarus mexicanus]
MYMSNEYDLETYVGAGLYRIMQFKPNIVPFDLWEIQLNNVIDQINLPDDKKTHFLLNMVESCVLDELKNQTNPIDPMNLSYEEIASILRRVYNNVPDHPKSTFNFITRLQMENESIRDFYNVLRIIAELCNFGKDKNKMIRKQFIKGLINENIQYRVEKMKTKNLEDIVSTAEQMQLEESYNNLEFDQYNPRNLE